MKLHKFWLELNKYRQEPDWEANPYDADRCCVWGHLLVRHNGEIHRLEVRYANYVPNNGDGVDTIVVSIVNWTLCAGPATLTLTEENVGQYIIEEDDPTVGLLYTRDY